MVGTRYILGVFVSCWLSFLWHAVALSPRRAVFDVLFVHDTAVDGNWGPVGVLEESYKKVVSRVSDAYPGSRFALATVSRKIQGLPLPGAAPDTCFKSWNGFSDDQEAFADDVDYKIVHREAKGTPGNDATLDAMAYLAGGDPQIKWRQGGWDDKEKVYVVHVMILVTDSPFLGSSDWGTPSSLSLNVDMFRCGETAPVSLADFTQAMEKNGIVPVVLAKPGAESEWSKALDTASRNSDWMKKFSQLQRLDEQDRNFEEVAMRAFATAANESFTLTIPERSTLAPTPQGSTWAPTTPKGREFESVDPKVAEEIAMTWECVYESGSGLGQNALLPPLEDPKFAGFKAAYQRGLCRKVNIGTIFAMIDRPGLTEGPNNSVYVNESIVHDTIACREEGADGEETITYSYVYSSVNGRSISWNIEDVTLTLYATTFIKSQWEKRSANVAVNEEWQYDVGEDGAPKNRDYKVDVDVELKKTSGEKQEMRTKALNFAALTANAGSSMTKKCLLLWKQKFSSETNVVAHEVDITEGLKRVSLSGVSVGSRVDIFQVVLRELHEMPASTQGVTIVQSVARRLLFIMEVSIGQLQHVIQEYVTVLTGESVPYSSQKDIVEDYFKIVIKYIEQSDNKEKAAWNCIQVLYNVIERVYTGPKFPWSGVTFNVEAETEATVYKEVSNIVLKLVNRAVVLLASDGKVSPPVSTETKEIVNIIRGFSGNYLGSVDINIVVDVLRQADVELNIEGSSGIVGYFVKQILYIIEYQKHLLPTIFLEHGKVLGFDTTVSTTYVEGLIQYIVKQRQPKHATAYCLKVLIEVIKRKVAFPESFPPEVVNIDLTKFWDVSSESDVHYDIMGILHEVSVRKQLVSKRNTEESGFDTLNLLTYMKKSFSGGESVEVPVVIEVLKEVVSWEKDSSLVILQPLARQLIYILQGKQDILVKIFEKHGRMLDIQTQVTSTTYVDVLIGFMWRQPDMKEAVAYCVKTLIQIIGQEVTFSSDFPEKYLSIDVTVLENGEVVSNLYHVVHRIVRQIVTYKTRDVTKKTNIGGSGGGFIEVVQLLKEAFGSIGGNVDINIVIDVLRKVETSYNNVSPIVVSLCKQLVFILEEKADLLPRIIERHGQLYVNTKVTNWASYVNVIVGYIEKHPNQKEAVAHCIKTLIEVIKVNVEFPITVPRNVVEIDLISLNNKAGVDVVYYNVVAILRDVCKRGELDVVVLLNRLSHVDLWAQENVIIDVFKDAEVLGGSTVTTTLITGFVKQWEHIVTYERNRLPVIVTEHKRRLQIELGITANTQGYLNVLVEYIQRQPDKRRATVYCIQTLIGVIRTQIKFPPSFPQEYLLIDSVATTDLVSRGDVYKVVAETVNDVVLIVDTPHYCGVETVDFFTDVIVLLEKDVSPVEMRRRLEYVIVKVNEIGGTEEVIIKEKLDLPHIVSVVVQKIGVEIRTGAVVNINSFCGGLLEDLSVSLLTKSLQWHVDFILNVAHPGRGGVVTVGVDDYSVLFRLIRKEIRTRAIRGYGEVVQFINVLRKGFNPEFVGVKTGLGVVTIEGPDKETPGGIFTSLHNTLQLVLVWNGQEHNTDVVPAGKPGSEFILFTDDLIAVLEKDVSDEDLRIRTQYLFNTIVKTFDVKKGGHTVVFDETWDVKQAIVEVLKHIGVEFKQRTVVGVNYQASGLLYDIAVALQKIDVQELIVTVKNTMKEFNEVETTDVGGTYYTLGQEFSSVLRIIRKLLSGACFKGQREFSDVVTKLRTDLQRRCFGATVDLGDVPTRKWVEIEDSKTSVFGVCHNVFVTALDANVDWIKKTHNKHTVTPTVSEDLVILLKRLSQTELSTKDRTIIDVFKDVVEIPARVESGGYLIVRSLVKQLVYILEDARDRLPFILTEHTRRLEIGGGTTISTPTIYLNLLIEYIEAQPNRNQAVVYCIQLLIEVIRKEIEFPPTFPRVFVDIDTTKMTSDTVLQSEVHSEVVNVVSSVLLVLNAGDYSGREIVDVYTNLIAVLEKDGSLTVEETQKRLRHVLVDIIRLDKMTPHGPFPRVDKDLQITYLIAQIVERVDVLVKREAVVDINVWGASLFRWISEGLIRESPEVLLVSLENTFVPSEIPRTTNIGHISHSVLFRFIRREYRKRAIRGTDVVTFVEGVGAHLKKTFGVSVEAGVRLGVGLAEGEEQEVSGGIFTVLCEMFHDAVVWDGYGDVLVPYTTPRVGTEFIRFIEDFTVILEKDGTDAECRKRFGFLFNVIVNSFTVTTPDATTNIPRGFNENWDIKMVVVETLNRIGREFREKAVVRVNYEASNLLLDISLLLSEMGVEELRETIEVAINELSWGAESLTVTGSRTVGKELAVILRVIHKRLTLASFSGEERLLEVIRKLVAIIRRRTYNSTTTRSLEDDIAVNRRRGWRTTEDTKFGVFQVCHAALVYVLQLDAKSLVDGSWLPSFHEGDYVGRQVVDLLIDVNALLGKDGVVSVAQKRMLYWLQVMNWQLKVAYNDLSFPHYYETMDSRVLTRVILRTIGVELERRAVVDVNTVTAGLFKDLSVALEYNDSRRIAQVIINVFNLESSVVNKVTTGFGGSLTDVLTITGLIQVGIEQMLVRRGAPETVLVIKRCREELSSEFGFVSQGPEQNVGGRTTVVAASEFDLGVFSVFHSIFRVALRWDGSEVTTRHEGWSCLSSSGTGLNTFQEIPPFVDAMLTAKGICDVIPKMAVDKAFVDRMVPLGNDFKKITMEDMLVVCRDATAADKALYKKGKGSSSPMRKAVETDWSGVARLLKAAFVRYPKDIVCHLARDASVTGGEATSLEGGATAVSVVCQTTSQKDLVRHFSDAMEVRTAISSFSREELTFRPRSAVICGVSDGLAVVHRWGGFSFAADMGGVWANGRYTIFKMAVDRKTFNVNMDLCSMDPTFFKLLVEEGLVAEDMKCCLTTTSGSVLGWNADAYSTPSVVCKSHRETHHHLIIVPHFFREERFEEKYLLTLFFYRRYRDAFHHQTPFVVLPYGDDDTVTVRQSLRCLLQIRSFSSVVLSRVVSVNDSRRRNCFAVSHRVLHESVSGTAIRLPRGPGYGAVCMDLGVRDGDAASAITSAVSSALASGIEIYWNVGAAKEEDRIVLEPLATPEEGMAESALKRTCNSLMDVNIPKFDSCLFAKASPRMSQSKILRTLRPMKFVLPMKYRSEMKSSDGCHVLQSEDETCKAKSGGQGCALVTSGVVCAMKRQGYKLYRGEAFSSVKMTFSSLEGEGYYDLKQFCTNNETTTSVVALGDYDIVAHLLGFQIESYVIRTMTLTASVVKSVLKVFREHRKSTTTTTTTTTTKAPAPVAEILPVVASAFAGALLLGGVGYFLARKRPEIPEEVEAEFDLSRNQPIYDDRQTVAQCDLEDFV